MRQDHPLGIDAFVSQTLSIKPSCQPHSSLLQECIKIMLQTGGNDRPIGRSG